MLNCFSQDHNAKPTPIYLIKLTDYPNWLQKRKPQEQAWLSNFNLDINQYVLLPEQDKIAAVVAIIEDERDLSYTGQLAISLPQGLYHFVIVKEHYHQAAFWWGLGVYQFTAYRKPKIFKAQLFLPNLVNAAHLYNEIESTYLVRDLINTPPEDMGPAQLSAAAEKLAKAYGASYKEIVGEELLGANFPAIYAVGKGSARAPRFIELQWGKASDPHLVLVGKGVCFDSGGYNLKTTGGMALMKKDMGGAAHVLGLAKMIMQEKLPIRLSVLIPAVDNLVSGNAYKPGDVTLTRKGLSVEIGNTDAEGRVVLSDALTYGAELKPKLIIDFATLTGAAKIALGPMLPALFSNQMQIGMAIQALSSNEYDPVWCMPLFKAYRPYLKSTIADINNNSVQPYAGAITAALFLQEFVQQMPWIHFDIMAWNITTLPGRPEGGEAVAMRSVFHYLKQYFLEK